MASRDNTATAPAREYDERASQSDNLLNLVFRGICVVLGCILLTLFLPGIIAHRNGVFYSADVAKRLPADASDRLRSFEGDKARLEANISALRQQLASVNNPAQQREFDFFTKAIAERRRELTALEPPVFTIGFFLSPQMLLWPAIYSSLGILLVCFKRRNAPPLRLKRLIAWGCLVYFYYEWPLWTRNFLLSSQGRKVYACTNFDIDPGSFLAQEATIAGFAFLVAGVWLRWSEDASRLRVQARLQANRSYLTPAFVLQLHGEFNRWVMGSIILGLGFVYFTTFFWSFVGTFGDQRYIASAILAHSLWALTWLFMSLPIFKLWLELKRRRLRAIDSVLEASYAVPGKREQLNLDTMEKLESIAGIRFSIATGSAVVSLLIPILQLYFQK